MRVRPFVVAASAAMSTLVFVAGAHPAPNRDLDGGSPQSHPAATVQPAAATQTARSQNLVLLGSTNLGGGGLHGPVAVIGTTALVGAGLVPNTGYHTERYNPLGCYDVTAKVVDFSNPRVPRVVARIPIPQGSAAIDVSMLRVNTSSFRGVLGAIAIDDGPSQSGPTGCAPAAGHTPPFFADRGVVYYDLTNPRAPRFLGRFHPDVELVPTNAPPCAPPPAGDRIRCARGQHSVDLVQRADGRVLSISTQPSGLVDRNPLGDVRIVDVTNPAAPTQVGAFPPPGPQRPWHFSPNGCAPFTNAHHASFYEGGRRAVVAYMDGGTFDLDLANPAAPSPTAQYAYPPRREVEGNAGFARVVTVGGRRLTLVAEEDWWPATTTVRIDAPASIAGAKFACLGTPNVFDPLNQSQLYRRPGSQVSGEIVYVGRGCSAGATQPADPYLANPQGKIAFIDHTRIPQTQPGIPASGANCRFDARILRAQAAGAAAVIFARVVAPPFADSPYAIGWGGMPTGVTIPGVMIDTPDADALRNALCPTVIGGTCVGGQAASGAMIDSRGEWGGLRVLDTTNRAAPRLLGLHHSATTRTWPPPDAGVYAPGDFHVVGSFAYTAWHADGARIVDISGQRPREVAFWVPRDRPDPTETIPAKAHVRGVAAAGDYVIVTDTNSGLYVLSFARPITAGGVRLVGTPGNDTLTGTPRADRILGLAGHDNLRGLRGNDVLEGGPGNDRLDGGPGNDRLLGGPGHDTLLGGPGNDVLVGGPGPNRYFGGPGNDRIDSRNGVAETVDCGPGVDTVIADAADRLIGCERVTRR